MWQPPQSWEVGHVHLWHRYCGFLVLQLDFGKRARDHAQSRRLSLHRRLWLRLRRLTLGRLRYRRHLARHLLTRSLLLLSETSLRLLPLWRLLWARWSPEEVQK